jgi:hypothetical protein
MVSGKVKKMRNYTNHWLLILVVFFLAACTSATPGNSAATAPSVSPIPQQAASTSTSLPITTPDVEKIATETPTPVAEQNQTTVPNAAAAAQKMLGDRLGVSITEMKVLSVEETQWPDGCLGAAKPDEICTQAIVNGYRVILQLSGKQYEFHTDVTGTNIREVQQPGPKGGNIINGTALTKARQFLAQELGINLSEIKLQSAKPVDWPDSCLGAAKAGQVCSQVLTPGYQFSFLAGGKQYEVHTDNEGGVVILAPNPVSVISGTVLTLERSENGACSRLEAGEGINYGTCVGSLEQGQLLPIRSDELNDLFSTFAPFSAETKAGKVVFQGTGVKTASSSEQRSIAEWAWLVFQEARSGRSGAAWGLVLSWHREGGIAGFCDDLAIYSSGWAYATSCRTNTPGDRYYRLSSKELDQLFAWADQFANSEMKQEDAPGAADSMSITLLLSGSGKAKVTSEQQQEMISFTQNIFNETAK